jgi:oligoribonuclease (3'-5' exoribonuclease)
MKNKLQPYFSIDTETTGLNPQNCQIIEIACVYDDGITDIDKLPIYQTIINCPRLEGEPYALLMNVEIIKEMLNSKTALPSGYAAIVDLELFIDKYNENSPNGKVNLAGKNLAMFDLKFLNKLDFKAQYKHRILDVGNMYFSKFGYVPSLQEINDLIGYKPVAHRALDDALNVVVAIRNIINEE